MSLILVESPHLRFMLCHNRCGFFSILENYPGECKSYLCFKLPWKIYRFNVISVSLAIFPCWKNYQVSTYSVFIICIAAGHRSQLYCLNVLSVSLAIFPIWKNYQVSATCVFIICIAAGHLSHLYHGLTVLSGVSLAIFPIWKNYQVSALCVCIICIAGHLSQLYGLKCT
jgi:hypothetical protein